MSDTVGPLHTRFTTATVRKVQRAPRGRFRHEGTAGLAWKAELPSWLCVGGDGHQLQRVNTHTSSH